MSIEVIKSQINNFLSNETPEIMAIKGKWGIGKTYSWNKFLEEAKNNKIIKNKKYSYVSLFGINSLDTFRYAIFEHTVSCDLIGTEANIETFKDNIVSTSSALGKKGVEFFKTRSTTRAIESFAFLSIRETIICLDDLERKGKGLDIKDVLGLVSLLKEQKKCKVILLLNDGEEGLEDYIKYREKVIDCELEFSLTAQESAEIALQGTELNGYVAKILKESSIRIDIRNIRVLKKIERFVKLITPYLDGCENELVYQVVRALTFLAWCQYRQNDSAPSLDYVSSRKRFINEKDDNDFNESWNKIIKDYGYFYLNDLDLELNSLLAKSVQSGYFIEEDIKIQLAKNNEEIIASKSNVSFYKAWELYNNSFEDNQDEIVTAIYNSFKGNTKYIDILKLDEAICLFRELYENDKVEEIIVLYFSARNETELAALGIKHSDIKDDNLREKVRVICLPSALNEETSEQRLARIAESNIWDGESSTILLNTSSDEYYELFKSDQGQYKYRSFISFCLNAVKFKEASDEQRKIANEISHALRKIASESQINKSRVARYGIQLDDE